VQLRICLLFILLPDTACSLLLRFWALAAGYVFTCPAGPGAVTLMHGRLNIDINTLVQSATIWNGD
jgi:hypothetical protein